MCSKERDNVGEIIVFTVIKSYVPQLLFEAPTGTDLCHMAVVLTLATSPPGARCHCHNKLCRNVQYRKT